MSNILQLLNKTETGLFVESGVIISALENGKYTVSVNGRESDIEATVASESLVPGVRVIINRTSAGRYIIGNTRQFKSQTSKEIIING